MEIFNVYVSWFLAEVQGRIKKLKNSHWEDKRCDKQKLSKSKRKLNKTKNSLYER